jgi:type IV secretory pathway VirB2 component (pilin)
MVAVVVVVVVSAMLVFSRLDFARGCCCCVWAACYCGCARIANSESGGRSRCISLWGSEVK